jgi:hypothetical protein
MSCMYEKMYSSCEVKKSDAIKIRLVFHVPYAYKDYAKETKLFWNANLKHWYHDLRFENIERAKEFIQSDEEFKFKDENIFHFKLKQIIDDNDYLEGDEYEKLINKFNSFQNNYIKK